VNGSPQLYLASSAPEKSSGDDSDRRLATVIHCLEECRALLAGSADRDADQLLAMAILELRMRLHHIGDAELKALCDVLTVESKEDPDLPASCGGS
jgi:hypothetical protein